MLNAFAVLCSFVLMMAVDALRRRSPGSSSAEEPSLASQNETSKIRGSTFLVVRVTLPDGAAEPMSAIRQGCEKAWEAMRRDSYGTFSPSAKYIEVSLPNRWNNAKISQGMPNHWWDVHSLAMKEVPDANDYAYRLVFLPMLPDSFGGMAQLGKPDAVFQKVHWYLPAHEVGHNFGLQHARSILPHETLRGLSFGHDHAGMMGIDFGAGTAENDLKYYTAVDRYQLGWLRTRDGEVVEASSGRYILTSLFEPISRGSHQAIKVPCPGCRPQVRATACCGGSLFVSFARGQVHVHLHKGSGSEHWGELTQVRATWSAPEGVVSSTNVRWCGQVFGDEGVKGAVVAIADSPAMAQTLCSR